VIDRLPGGQRAVILLRDMEGRDADETCGLLEISAENQRVLLHRARCRIRQEIDRLIGIEPATRPLPVRRPRAKDGAERAFQVVVGFGRLVRGVLVVAGSGEAKPRATWKPRAGHWDLHSATSIGFS
jgi:hypothetical protein